MPPVCSETIARLGSRLRRKTEHSDVRLAQTLWIEFRSEFDEQEYLSGLNEWNDFVHQLERADVDPVSIREDDNQSLPLRDGLQVSD